MTVLVALIPIIITSLFIMIYNKKSIKNINFNKVLDVILCGFLSVILVLPLYEVFKVVSALTTSIFAIDINKISFLVTFVMYLFTAGIPEEIAKWIAIKSSRPKNSYSILVNSIYISLIFMILENYAKANAQSSMTISMVFNIYRIFLPIHIMCQLVMAILLIKSNENKKMGNKKKAIFFNILSIIIPIFIHTLYDTLVSINNNYSIIQSLYFVITIIFLGICTYIATFIAIAKVTKKNDSEEISKTKINKKKLILVIILSIISIIVFRVKNT